MATKDAALHGFFSGFGLTAYVNTNVPEDAKFPYLTYTPVFDSWGNQVSIGVNLWYNTTSETVPNSKAQEISDALPVYVKCDGGAVLIDRGSPFCQSMADDSNQNIKRRYINMTAEYITLN